MQILLLALATFLANCAMSTIGGNQNTPFFYCCTWPASTTWQFRVQNIEKWWAFWRMKKPFLQSFGGFWSPEFSEKIRNISFRKLSLRPSAVNIWRFMKLNLTILVCWFSRLFLQYLIQVIHFKGFSCFCDDYFDEKGFRKHWPPPLLRQCDIFIAATLVVNFYFGNRALLDISIPRCFSSIIKWRL